MAFPIVVGLALWAMWGAGYHTWALGLLATAAAVYGCSCAWWPFGKCLRCKGAGRLSRKDGKVFRLCPRCKATGRRLRVGRVVWNQFNSSKRRAK